MRIGHGSSVGPNIAPLLQAIRTSYNMNYFQPVYGLELRHYRKLNMTDHMVKSCVILKTLQAGIYIFYTNLAPALALLLDHQVELSLDGLL